MIERAIADGCRWAGGLADSAYGDNSEFRRRVRCEGLGYAVGYTPYDHGVAPGFAGTPNRWTPWRSVIWPTPSGEVAFAG